MGKIAWSETLKGVIVSVLLVNEPMAHRSFTTWKQVSAVRRAIRVQLQKSAPESSDFQQSFARFCHIFVNFPQKYNFKLLYSSILTTRQ